MSRVLLTAQGAERLRKELKNLKSVDRPRVIAAISEARSHGDLSENAEYDAAKEQQGFIEGRISELDAQLSKAEILNPRELNANGRVIFGSWVKLYDEGNDAEVRYQIVGDLEADLARGQVSLSSPVGRALIGKQEGDEVEVKTPGGIRSYEILDVSYE